LDEADKEWNWEGVKAWNNITVDYIWRLEDGTVFDTSVESVAKACGKYTVGRNYEEWLTFNAQGGEMIKWFDNGVIGMKIWQTKTVQFWPEEWYGEYDENLLITISLEELWDITWLSEWDRVNLWGYPVTVIKITDKEVIFDMNSELAGKNLIFDITLKSINN
jgi:FKBP-type peptidyl-prolyl cis-trans isomerase 2